MCKYIRQDLLQPSSYSYSIGFPSDIKQSHNSCDEYMKANTVEFKACINFQGLTE